MTIGDVAFGGKRHLGTREKPHALNRGRGMESQPRALGDRSRTSSRPAGSRLEQSLPIVGTTDLRQAYLIRSLYRGP